MKIWQIDHIAWLSVRQISYSILIAAILISSNGCGFMWARAMYPKESCSPPFAGIRACREFCPVGCIFDCPLGLVADVAVLPWDLLKRVAVDECRLWTETVENEGELVVTPRKSPQALFSVSAESELTSKFPDCKQFALEGSTYYEKSDSEVMLKCLKCVNPVGLHRRVFGHINGLPWNYSRSEDRSVVLPKERGEAVFTISNKDCSVRSVFIEVSIER